MYFGALQPVQAGQADGPDAKVHQHGRPEVPREMLLLLRPQHLLMHLQLNMPGWLQAGAAHGRSKGIGYKLQQTGTKEIISNGYGKCAIAIMRERVGPSSWAPTHTTVRLTVS